jgi:hypothetical protein
LPSMPLPPPPPLLPPRQPTPMRDPSMGEFLRMTPVGSRSFSDFFGDC